MKSGESTSAAGDMRPAAARFNIRLFFLLAGAAAVRIFLAVRFRSVISFDEAHYIRLAASFWQHGLFGILHPYWPPLFPLAIALFKIPAGDFETAGRLVNILAGCGIVALVHGLAGRIFSEKEALLSAAFAAFYPSFAFHSTNVMPESLFSLLALAGMSFGWRALEEKRGLSGFAAGLCWGAAYLVRPEGVGFLLVFTGFTGLLLLLKGFRKGGWRRIPACVWALCGFTLLAGPYWVYLHEVTGHWTLSTKGSVNQQLETSVTFRDQSNPDPFYHLTADNKHLPMDMAYHFGTLRELSGLRPRSGRVVSVSPAQFAEKYARNLYHAVKTAIPEALTLAPFVLFVAGLTGGVLGRRRFGFSGYLLGNLLFFWFLLVPMFHLNERYFLPLLPVCLIWTGPGMKALSRWAAENLRAAFQPRSEKSRWPSRFGTAAAAAFVIGLGFLPEAARFAGMRPDSPDLWADPVELKRAGEWLRSHTAHPAVLMDANKAVDYYAGQFDIRKGAAFSYDTPERNAVYARHRGVEYMVFSSRYLSWYPNLGPLVEKHDLPAGLTLVYEDDRPTGVRTVVYRVSPADSSRSAGEGMQ
jgi:4-amino-4-deoxy-L-arabinose transferase-like glycosyltransferase